MNALDLRDVAWVKSSKSANGNCVEVARLREGRFGLRDSKNPAGGVLVLAPAEWEAFVGRLKNGELDI
jgi:hypothetical protein